MSTLKSRDTFVIELLKASNLTGRQQVVQVCTEANRERIRLPNQSDADVELDVKGLQTAITSLANAGTRSITVAALAAQPGGTFPLWPPNPTLSNAGLLFCQNGVDTTALIYQQRALAGGA